MSLGTTINLNRRQSSMGKCCSHDLTNCKSVLAFEHIVELPSYYAVYGTWKWLVVLGILLNHIDYVFLNSNPWDGNALF